MGIVFIHFNLQVNGRGKWRSQKALGKCGSEILKTNQLKPPSRTKPHTQEKLLVGESKLIFAGIIENKGKRK